MCRGKSLGVCCEVGCESLIRCQDTGGYCDAHDPMDWTEPFEPTDDPEKRRVYDLAQVRRAIKSTRTAILQYENNLAHMLAKEARLLTGATDG